MPRHMLEVRELTAEAFAPYGQVIAPLRTGGQGAETRYDPETSPSEAKLVLGHGEPRLWIMHLPHVVLPAVGLHDGHDRALVVGQRAGERQLRHEAGVEGPVTPPRRVARVEHGARL